MLTIVVHVAYRALDRCELVPTQQQPRVVAVALDLRQGEGSGEGEAVGFEVVPATSTVRVHVGYVVATDFMQLHGGRGARAGAGCGAGG